MDIRRLVIVAFTAVSMLMRLVELFLFFLVECYDSYMYSPLQAALWPVVTKVPRTVVINGKPRTVFTANIVSWSRTLLVVPIAVALKHRCYWTGFWCVVLHDFLDHLDGIVAKAQRQMFGDIDDPVLGGFMDAFCDKIVNVLTLWSVLLVTDFTNMSWLQTVVFVFPCVVVIGYEFTLGVVRVQDFFMAYYLRKFKKTDLISTKTGTAAVMEGKLKEKLESVGLAALCLAQAHPVAIASLSGSLGICCLLLSIRLAHSSLVSKLNARAPQIRSQAHASDDEDEMKDENIRCKTSNDFASRGTQTNFSSHLSDNSESLQNVHDHEKRESHEMFSLLPRCKSLNDTSLQLIAERVYTVGCFDLFHYGHVQLLKQMRTFGKKVIVGVHDSRSIYQLKQKVPVDSTVTRMRNVKQYADEVFCVAGTDPSPFLDSIFDKSNHKSSAIYIRGDDMPQFPARSLCESLMTVKFLPYTTGISSTKLRKDLFNSSYYSATLHDGLDNMMLY
ncbi:unnamed protein product [Candidula unifasciata]|uniref:Cytidyltransferase-like domain-containing protein n=1 Tax=Candidula unifasciata TaxID=100452 RepID=A0A8S3YS02_9EUPU|nr:unnamed protein product [Candidula unifasciata]